MIRCTCCRGFIADRVPCFGYQRDVEGYPPIPLKNCPACRSTVAAPMPAIVVTVRGIVGRVRPRVERRAA